MNAYARETERIERQALLIAAERDRMAVELSGFRLVAACPFCDGAGAVTVDDRLAVCAACEGTGDEEIEP